MKIGIIGTGLIGGSLAFALSGNKKYQIYCWNRKLENSKKTVKKTKIKGYFETIEQLTTECDIIIIATPLGSYSEITKKIAKKFTASKILSDIGSVKAAPTAEIFKNLPKKFHKNFVPAHPIAGSEKAGIASAQKDLFRNKKFIITKMANCNRAKAISKIWKDAGSNVEYISAKKHDEVYGYVSHYVQFLSHKLAKYFTEDMGEFSRLMRSPQEMWIEIFNYNKENLKKINSEFIKKMKADIKNLNKIKGKTQQDILAKFIAENYADITPVNYRKYAGTGYKSFTSVIQKTNKGILANADTKKKIEKIINELEKTKF